MRKITRPTTARCDLPLYVGFLLSEPKHVSCRRLGEIMNISHDSVN
ncbi:MAG: IS701 family transposase, partial [Methylobacter sp.]|nr:IS701 family transposase [Candidatus Methylobacter titanis]